MTPALPDLQLPRVCAVSYLNTVPLVWGFLNGPQAPLAELSFAVPSECARRIENGSADIGIVPVIEMQRQGLEAVPGTGIACEGAVRSILLISQVAPSAIRTLAVDSGSRTSVALARIVLRQRYGAEPTVQVMAPQLETMLHAADAALLIGDAALAVDPSSLPYQVLDLGTEWNSITGLPMVFAVWAGRSERVAPLRSRGIDAAFRDSLDYGLQHINPMVEEESRRRGFSNDLVHRYLTRHIRYHIGPREQAGMDCFLQYAGVLEEQVAHAQS